MFRSYKDRTVVCVSKNKLQERNSQFSTCDFCKAGYISESEIEVHRRKEHKGELEKIINDKEKFVCYTCITEFPNKQELIRHTKREHLLSSEDAIRIEREIFVCDICYSIFFNKDMLAVHLMHIHYISTQDKNITWVTCPVCFKSVRLRGAWGHFQKHQLQSVSCCNVCFTKCQNRKTLQEHLKSHLPHLYCNICGYAATKAHMFKNHIIQRYKYNMYVCQKVDFKKYFITNGKSPRVHWRFENLCAWRGVKNLNGLSVCILCREICKDYISMNLHIVRDHMTQMQELCDTSTTMKTVKNRHVCSCGDEFFNYILLKHHVFKMKGVHRLLEQHEIPDRDDIPETSGTQDLM